jgi:hypothetical protein
MVQAQGTAAQKKMKWIAAPAMQAICNAVTLIALITFQPSPV